MSKKLIQPQQWNRKRLRDLIRQLKGKQVLVVGDVGVDRYTHGEVERISPEAPVPIVRVVRENFKLGLAANVADNVKSLGGVPWMAGIIGSDRSSDDFKGLLRKGRMDPSCLVMDRSRRTALKERIVTESQQLLRVDYETVKRISAPVQKALLRKIQSRIKKVDAVVLEDYAKGLFSPQLIRSIIAISKKAGVPVLVDPSGKCPIEDYRSATILTPNKKEAETLSGRAILASSTPSLRVAGELLLERSQADHILLTLGREGMAIFSRGSRDFTMIPTCAREVYDVSGAGDTVISVIALAWAAGASLVDAAILSNIAAGVVVSKRGTATTNAKELLQSLS